MKKLAFFPLLIFLVHPEIIFSQEEISLEEIVKLYERGEIKRVIKELERLLQPLKLKKKEDIILARKYLGFCYVLSGEEEKARLEFIKMLDLAPEITLDPLVVLPEICKVFQEAKRIRKMIEEEVARRVANLVHSSSSPSRRGATLVVLLPGGIPQFRKGEKNKGYFFLITQSLASVISILAYLKLNTLYSPEYDGYLNEPLAKVCLGIQKIGFGVAVISYLTSVLEALWK
jgi:hypothetical protein